MNFKLVAFVTLIGVGLTVRGDSNDCNDRGIDIVTKKNRTHQEFTQDLIYMDSSWDARQALNNLSLEDRQEVRKFLQEKLLLWVAEHGSEDVLKAQEQRRLHGERYSLAVILAALSFATAINLFDNIFYPKYPIDVDVFIMKDVFGVFKYLGMTTPNQKLATVVLASAATATIATVFGIASSKRVAYENERIDESNKELQEKRRTLERIKDLFEYCA